MSENVTELPARPGLYRGPVADARTAQTVEAVKAAETLGELDDALFAHRPHAERLPSEHARRVRDAVDTARARLRREHDERMAAATPRMSPTEIAEGLERLEHAKAEISAESYWNTRCGLERAIVTAPINDQDDVIAALVLAARFMPDHAQLPARLLDIAKAVEAGACTSPE